MDDIKIKGLEKQLIGTQDAELVEEYTIKIPLEKTQIKRKLILQFMYSLDLSEDIKNVSTSALSLDTSVIIVVFCFFNYCLIIAFISKNTI